MRGPTPSPHDTTTCIRTHMTDPGQISTRRAYSGRIISLDVDSVRFPDGSTGELEMVRHPGASAVVPFLSDPAGDDPQVLLVRQYRYAADGYLYEIPAGRLDAGEDPADCARRELREETGCTAERVELLMTLFTTPGFTDEKIHIFLATGLTAGDSAREADEFMEMVPMPLSRALEMVERGEIQDAKTVVGLLYAAGFRAGM
jgi:ADP-ribose pyrophosphatase